MEITVDQQGADVLLQLWGPVGSLLATIDSPNGTRGPEPLLWVAELSGEHRLEVLGAPATPSGFYRLTEDRRQATPSVRDRRCALAQRVFFRAEELRREGTPGALARARGGYLESLDLWKGLGESVWEAAAWERSAWIHQELGDLPEAIRSLEVARKLLLGLRRDPQALARVLSRLGELLSNTGERERALAAYGAMLDLAVARGDSVLEATAANDLALVHRESGRTHEALSHYHLALSLWQQVGDRRKEAITLSNLGDLYAGLGCLARAHELLDLSLQAQCEADPHCAPARTLGLLAKVQRLAGAYEKARESFLHVLWLHAKTRDRRGEAEAWNGLGLTELRLQQFGAARDSFFQAEALYLELGDPVRASIVRLNLGWLFDAWQRPLEAKPCFQTALERFRVHPSRSHEASALFGSARAEAHLGRLALARAQLQKSLVLIEDLRSDAWSPSFRSFYLSSKYDYYLFQVELLMASHAEEPTAGFDRAAFYAAEQARGRALLDQLARVANSRTEAAEKLEERRREVADQISQLVERAQGSRREGLAHLPGQLSRWLIEQEALAGELQVLRATGPSLFSPPVIGLPEAQGLLDPETCVLAYTLGERASYLWWFGRDGWEVHVLPAEQDIRLHVDRVIDLLGTRLSESQQHELEGELALLSEMLLAPVAPRLASHRRLILVQDGVLQGLPFALLPVPAADSGPPRPLIDFHELSSTPSLSVLAMLRARAQRTAPPPMTLAVFADPVFDPGDPRLPTRPKLVAAGEVSSSLAHLASIQAARSAGLDCFERLPASGREAEALADLVPLSQRWVVQGLEASRSTVLSADLTRFRILHFATHSFTDPLHPELSGLVLSLTDGRGQPRDGLLRLQEIYDLPLNADLVTLSSCQSALGQPLRGEGLRSLAQAFFFAGARAVLASLWSVDDEATAHLMAYFYEALFRDGLSPQAALRRAQMRLREDPSFSHPADWAGFLVLGDDGPWGLEKRSPAPP
ncbi:MAG TPA: CHAT domain-containing tetratricopeptide repeat protein [Thermoanaerobaculia bacterium]|nr:CHAT domain-containing tetratricopeptide repeat protein [Thermoanaerobaculia bacterium]